MAPASEPAWGSVRAEGAQGLAPGQGRQITGLLRLSAEEQQGIGAQEAGGVGGGHADATLGQGLQDQAVLHAAQPQAAVGLGDDGAAEVGLGQIGQDVPGEGLFFVQLGPDGLDALLGDLAGQILEHRLLLGEQVVHGPALLRGLGDHQPALVKTARGADMVRQARLIALGAVGQLRRGQVVMGAPRVPFRTGCLMLG